MTRRYARSLSSKRAVDHAPLGTPANTTILSSIRVNGKSAYTTYTGGTTAERFRSYLENVLLPTLDENSVIVMDNMKSHHAKIVTEFLDEHKVTYLYLPPYSPDLNPIEMLWSKLKSVLRKLKVRTANKLPQAIAEAFLAISQQDCRAWFRAWKDGENETRESFLNGKQVIIRMNRSDNINRTTSIAAIEMAKTAVLSNGKRYMDDTVSRASDYLVARKLVAHINNGQSLGYFDEVFFRPLYDENEEFRKYFDQLIATDKNGMYVSVFLNEIRKMSETLFPEPTNENAQRDTIGFLRFLYDLCNKNGSANFRYTGTYIKVDVAFTGDSYILFSQGYEFYVKKCYEALCDKIHTVYIFALGMKMHDAIGVEELFHQQHPSFAETKRTEYIHTFANHQKKYGICIEFQKTI